MAVIISDLPAGQKIPRNLPGFSPAVGPNSNPGPDNPTPDYVANQDYWMRARALIEGLQAMIMGGETFLPKHPEELGNDYNFRLNNAVLTNIFADILDTLSAKPFANEVHIIDGSASVAFTGTPRRDGDGITQQRTGGFMENVDGSGSHIHVFLHEVMYYGIGMALDWIFVDYPKGVKNLSAQREKELGVNPYWYRIPADCMFDVQSDMVGGKEIFIYCRFRDNKVVRNGFGSQLKTRVREIIRDKISANGEPNEYGVPYYNVWELDDSQPNPGKQTWTVVETDQYTIGEIPLVPFLTGRREGRTWKLKPALKSAVDLQIELYRRETGLANNIVLTCYPMLVAIGVDLKDDKGNMQSVVIGPHSILCAPPAPVGAREGSWNFIEPNAQSQTFVKSTVDDLKRDLRELGKVPLTADSQNITVITAAFATDKANSAVEAWAINLKDAGENALRLTALWMNDQSEPELQISLDDLQSVDDAAITNLTAMRAKSPPDISQPTYWSELKKKGALSVEFDAARETELLAKELPTDAEVLAAAGVDPSNPNPGGPPIDPNALPTPPPPQTPTRRTRP